MLTEATIEFLAAADRRPAPRWFSCSTAGPACCPRRVCSAGSSSRRRRSLRVEGAASAVVRSSVFRAAPGCSTSAMRSRPASTRSASTPRCRWQFARDAACSRGLCVQGNLDPVALLVGGDGARPGGAPSCGSRLAAAAVSSISATASCPKRRPSMSPSLPDSSARRWRPADMPRTAVVLMNLGRPRFARRGAAVSDQSVQRSGDHPAALAAAAAAGAVDRARRARGTAREIYAHLGGGSPLLANTEAQARALEAALGAELSLRLSRCATGIR